MSPWPTEWISGPQPCHVSILLPDLGCGYRAVEEHQRVHAAIAGVPFSGVLREAAADLDASGIAGRRVVLPWARDFPGIAGAHVETIQRFAVPVEGHGALGEIEGRREEHPLVHR